MLPEAHSEIVGAHLDAENAHRLDETLATRTEDCVFDDKALGLVYRRRAGAAEYNRLWWDAFGVEVAGGARYVTTARTLISEAGYQAVHRGEFLGLAPAGRSTCASWLSSACATD